MTESESTIVYGCLHPNYSEEIAYFKECKVFSVQIESTLKCTQGCLYCYASANEKPGKELLTSDIITVLDSAAMMGVRAVDWLGGDPLLRNDWYELMKYATGKGLRNNIWTSGIPLADVEVAKKVVEISEGGFVSVHLDSLDEGIYKKLHEGDAKEKINAILKGVDNVQSLGKKPENMIDCITFTKPVAGEDVRKTMKYFFEEKGMRTCLTQICECGLALAHPEWVPTIEEIRDACVSRDKMNYAESRTSISAMDVNKFYCGGVICITTNGDVTPCSVIRKGFGNINETPLQIIIDEHKDELLLTHLRDPQNMSGHCRDCTHNSVCWGCRATAYYTHGDLLAEDPKCWMNPRNYESLAGERF
jgi:radical SAM protein with 4Fe4S-binding SPASM domain